MAPDTTDHIDPTLLETASNWYSRIHGGSASDGDIVRHTEWLLENPAHLEAYEHVASSMQAVGAFEQQMRAAYASDFTVSQKQGNVQSSGGVFSSLFDSWRWPHFASAAAAMAALLFVAILPNVPTSETGQAPHYYTASSSSVEHIQLADGSRVALFAGTDISYDETSEARVVELASGRAFFDVVSDETKPFYVRAGNRQVRVVGTRFEVIKTGSFERIAVNEGLVSVSTQKNGEETDALLIEPGTIARYDAGNDTPVVSQTAPENIALWKEGVLAFRDKPLFDVLAAIRQLFPDSEIQLADEALASRPFSGTLVVSDAETMVTQLVSFLSLRVVRDGDILTISSN